jgi:hypothetical protein
MKTVKFALISIMAIGVLAGFSSPALARTRVSVGIGFGFPLYHHHGFHHRYYGHYGRHYRPYWGPVIVGGGYWYDWEPSCYVETRPVIIERTPVIIERQPAVVQPPMVNENTFRDLRQKKSEFLKILQIGDRDNRIKAINELAGFSFDDKVRQAIEKVLFSDPDAELRLTAAQSLGKVKNHKALAALEKARVEDENADVRKAADESIKKIEGTAS